MFSDVAYVILAYAPPPVCRCGGCARGVLFAVDDVFLRVSNGHARARTKAVTQRGCTCERHHAWTPFLQARALFFALGCTPMPSCATDAKCVRAGATAACTSDAVARQLIRSCEQSCALAERTSVAYQPPRCASESALKSCLIELVYTARWACHAQSAARPHAKAAFALRICSHRATAICHLPPALCFTVPPAIVPMVRCARKLPLSAEPWLVKVF